MSGWRSAGWDRVPPIAGLKSERSDQSAYMHNGHDSTAYPMVAPVDHAMGMNA